MFAFNGKLNFLGRNVDDKKLISEVVKEKQKERKKKEENNFRGEGAAKITRVRR